MAKAIKLKLSTRAEGTSKLVSFRNLAFESIEISASRKTTQGLELFLSHCLHVTRVFKCLVKKFEMATFVSDITISDNSIAPLLRRTLVAARVQSTNNEVD